jgi:hypothetical protein
MSTLSRCVALFGVLVLIGSAHAAQPVREVSLRKVVKAGGVVALEGGESQVGIRVRTSEVVKTKGGVALGTAASKKAERTLFLAGMGKFVAETAKGPVTFKVVAAGTAKTSDKSRQAAAEDRPYKRFDTMRLIQQLRVIESFIPEANAKINGPGGWIAWEANAAEIDRAKRERAGIERELKLRK